MTGESGFSFPDKSPTADFLAEEKHGDFMGFEELLAANDAPAAVRAGGALLR